MRVVKLGRGRSPSGPPEGQALPRFYFTAAIVLPVAWTLRRKILSPLVA